LLPELEKLYLLVDIELELNVLLLAEDLDSEITLKLLPLMLEYGLE
jgi:hypothetical protein